MEPVSYVPPCARPFTTVTVPVSRPQRNMATQTSEDICSRSVDTQTPGSICACYSSSVLSASSTDASTCCNTNHADLDKDKSRSVVTNTTVESEKELSQEKPEVQKDLGNHDVVSKAENMSESTTRSPPLRRGRGSKAKEEERVPTTTKNGSERVLRKRKSDPVGEKGLGKEPNRKSKKSNRRV